MTGESCDRFRTEPRRSDAVAVHALIARTGFFNPEEVRIAQELVDERLERGVASGYEFLFADDESGNPIGYTCYGKIDGTASSYDLYWIAVAPSSQRTGLGRRLLAESERLIALRGGRRIYVETSSRDQYHPTRAFYERCGYRMEAVLPDFYADGDGKVIYCREVF